jgi:uncharacterized membrane protein YkvA (DUF1232 family)
MDKVVSKVIPKIMRAGKTTIHLPPFLARLIIDQRVPLSVRTNLVISSGYILLPISIFSKKKWGILGYWDDILLGFTTLNLLFKEVPKEVLSDNWGGQGEDLENLREWVFSVTTFLRKQPARVLKIADQILNRKNETKPLLVSSPKQLPISTS